MTPTTIRLATTAAALSLGFLAGYGLCAYNSSAWPFAGNRVRLSPAGGSDADVAWAQPVALEGCPNLYRVSDNIYRGGQPSEKGFTELKKLGIKTIVNLRLLGSDRDETQDVGLGYEHIKVEAWDADTDEVVRFLRIAVDESRGPIFVHCKHGSDRTGMMVAIYRVVVQGWDKDDAIDEMTRGGFGYHDIFDDIVEYIRDADVARLRRLAGMAEPS